MKGEEFETPRLAWCLLLRRYMSKQTIKGPIIDVLSPTIPTPFPALFFSVSLIAMRYAFYFTVLLSIFPQPECKLHGEGIFSSWLLTEFLVPEHCPAYDALEEDTQHDACKIRNADEMLRNYRNSLESKGDQIQRDIWCFWSDVSKMSEFRTGLVMWCRVGDLKRRGNVTFSTLHAYESAYSSIELY